MHFFYAKDTGSRVVEGKVGYKDFVNSIDIHFVSWYF